MEQFIGTKIVKAWPMYRVTTTGSKTPGKTITFADESTLAKSEKYFTEHGITWEKEDGYEVVYQGGYVSWSPKEVFEAAYRRTDGLSFGLALEAAKKGLRIARQGWNGKGQYVELGHDFQYTCAASDIPGSVGVQHMDIGSKALVFVGTRGSQVGWLASQSDMLADDWYIVE